MDIVDDEDYQKNETFYIELCEPIIDEKAKEEAANNEAGRARLGEQSRVEISIKESKAIKVSHGRSFSYSPHL